MSGESITTVKSKNIKDMVVRFGECASATEGLSKSLEKFTDIFLKLEKNINILEKTEKNMSDNDQIKKVIHITDDMNDIFDYFKQNIPQLFISMKASKEELDKYKEEIRMILEHLRDLPEKIKDLSNISENTSQIRTLLNEIDSFQMNDEIEKIKLILTQNSSYNQNILEELQSYVDDKNKKMKSQYTRTKKKMMEEIKKEIDESLLEQQNMILNKINDHTRRILEDTKKSLIKDFENIANDIFQFTTISDEVKNIDSIYNLYINNGRKLPIKVRKIMGWDSDYYFVVRDFKKYKKNESIYLYAYGQVRNGNEIYDDNFYFDADSKTFILYDDTPIFMPIDDDDDIPF